MVPACRAIDSRLIQRLASPLKRRSGVAVKQLSVGSQHPLERSDGCGQRFVAGGAHHRETRLDRWTQQFSHRANSFPTSFSSGETAVLLTQYLAPGALKLNQVYALTAFVLQLNGIIGMDTVIDARSLTGVAMPNRNGFVADPRPDVRSTP